MALRRIGLHAPYVCHRQFHRAFHFELARIASPLVVAGLGQRRQRALRHGQRDIHGLLPSGPGGPSGPSGGCGGWGGFLCFRTRLCLHCHAGSVFGGGHGSALPLVERADGDRLGAMAGQKDRRHGLDSCVNKTPIDGGGCNAGSGVSTLRAFRLAANVAAPGWAGAASWAVATPDAGVRGLPGEDLQRQPGLFRRNSGCSGLRCCVGGCARHGCAVMPRGLSLE